MARRWARRALPLRFLCLLLDSLCEDFRYYPRGEPWHREGTDSVKVV